KPGYRRIVDRWLLLHLSVGGLISSFAGITLGDASQAVLLPLMAVFVGLTFSWAGNAHALLQSSEIIQLASGRSGGIAEYIFTFQLSILIVLVTLLGWIIPLLELPFLVIGDVSSATFNYVSEWLLYALMSLSF